MYIDDVENDMTVEEEAHNWQTMGINAGDMADDAQTLMDAISESNRDDLDDLYNEMVEIRDKAEEISEKLGCE